MDHELAKELKDAGFPLRRAYSQEDKGVYFVSNEPQYFQPTLSELIDACGDSFYALQKEGQSWRVTGVGFNLMNEKIMIQDSFTTPEIAVARLWLALQVK